MSSLQSGQVRVGGARVVEQRLRRGGAAQEAVEETGEDLAGGRRGPVGVDRAVVAAGVGRGWVELVQEGGGVVEVAVSGTDEVDLAPVAVQLRPVAYPAAVGLVAVAVAGEEEERSLDRVVRALP
jgi:hypothetical protein